jgi:DNA/RNA-binding domain of Phe-tRNA-synthetase-like protein
MQMKYEVSIDKALLNVYPEIRLGLIRFRADVHDPDEQFWAFMNEEVLPQVRNAIERKEWSEIPGVRGSRAAYKAFGRNPGRYRVSSEALIRRVRRGDELYHINSVVDVNNLISVKSGLSAGSYDLNRIHGAVTLRKAEHGEGYSGIGKDFLDMENMLVLADDEGIFGSSMSDSTRAMVTEETRDVLVVIYCFENDIDLEAILEEAETAFKRYAAATDTETWII